MQPGVSHRSARICRTKNLIYESADNGVVYVIPIGTPIGMSSIIHHRDEQLFPNPEDFKPERWLLDDKRNHQLERNLLSFGKGTRSCIGQT